MSPVRWGILGCAKIAERQVVPAMQLAESCVVTAIASRDLARAEAAAERLGIPVALGTYEELLARDDVDAVYIPLPNHLHVPWSIRSLASGKHVLCEKPIAMSAAEARQLRDASRARSELKVMEAFMYRFHPQWVQARRIVSDGSIGELHAIDTIFSYSNVDPQNIRNRPELGGGALMDIGCYGVSVARFLFGTEPSRVMGTMQHDPRFHTDRVTSAILEFDEGVATFTCGTQLAPFQRVQVLGSRGRIEIEIPFNAPADRPCRFWLQRGTDVEEIVVDSCNQYTAQGEQFARSVLQGTAAPVPLEDAVANMDVIDAVVESARHNSWVDVAALSGRG
jgi:predicted dehydrogenase